MPEWWLLCCAGPIGCCTATPEPCKLMGTCAASDLWFICMLLSLASRPAKPPFHAAVIWLSRIGPREMADTQRQHSST